ncbi:hypothetical protein GW17_00060514 [Ensete ventricosum]|nr:hypothetical protein GW17_00060514 [Ensete ventricosum]
MYVHKPKDTDKHEHFIKHLVYILSVTTGGSPAHRRHPRPRPLFLLREETERLPAREERSRRQEEVTEKEENGGDEDDEERQWIRGYGRGGG